MQYFKPAGDFFVGDCMPFWHDGVFHLYWLLDEQHHQALGGLGGHQWAHSSTRDLVHWEQHPLALGIDYDWEGSICTGSLLHHAGRFYAFYATRMRDRSQHLALAVSDDAIHFAKTQPNPLASPPPPYAPQHYRDPVVFRDDTTGLFHMLVTAQRLDYPIPGRGGCLAHLTSPDLHAWTLGAPFLTPGFADVPECPDFFRWGDWYYLIFANHGVARYRMARTPFGPWQRPAVDAFDGPYARVLKTAAFGPDRRIGAAWIGTRTDDRDDGKFQFGGHMVLREIVQQPDGTLATRFPAELVPPTGSPLPGLSPLVGARVDGDTLSLAGDGLAAARLSAAPRNLRITATVAPATPTTTVGLRLRGQADFSGGYELRLSPHERRVALHDAALCAVDGLDRPFTLDVVLVDDLIDMCVDGRRTLVNRCPAQTGDSLFFWTQAGAATFRDILIRPLMV